MFGSQANEKRRVKLSGLNTAKCVSIRDHKDVSGIDWAFCSVCHKPLCHDNYYGRNEGAIFWVSGYMCPKCGHKEGNTTRFKNWLHSVVPFNWQTLGIPSNQSKTPEGRS